MDEEQVPEKMSVEFFVGWIRDQFHDDDERETDDPLKYSQMMWDEVVDMLSEAAWEEVAMAMWHVYDPNHVMHKMHPIEEVG